MSGKAANKKTALCYKTPAGAEPRRHSEPKTLPTDRKHTWSGFQGREQTVSLLSQSVPSRRLHWFDPHGLPYAAFCWLHVTPPSLLYMVPFSSLRCSIQRELDVDLYLKEVQLIYYVQYCVFYTVFSKKEKTIKIFNMQNIKIKTSTELTG